MTTSGTVVDSFLLPQVDEKEDMSLELIENDLSLGIDLGEILLATTKKSLFAIFFLSHLTNRIFKYMRPSLVRFLYWFSKFLSSSSEITKDLCKSLFDQHKAETKERIAVRRSTAGVSRDINGVPVRQ
jgi:hypothetical protein|tara:strand:+ start:71 stop:454 length:384 start_codon:yes stop_codon:yes gene_type:complete